MRMEKKHRASIVTKGWDDKTTLFVHMVMETIARVKKSDSTRRDWCVQGKEMNTLVDANSLAIEVLLEKNRVVIKDACWLQPRNDAAHINLAELDTVLKGINLALQWESQKTAYANQLLMHAPLGVRYLDRQSQEVYKDSQQDAYKKNPKDGLTP